MNIFLLGCNGNLGKYIADNLSKDFNNKVIGIDIHDSYQGNSKNITYFEIDFLSKGITSQIKNLILSCKETNCFVNLIAKDYPVGSNDLCKNSPFELNLDEICESYKVTLGSSYLLIQNLLKFKNSKFHILLIGSIYSRNLPNLNNYSEDQSLYKPIAYSLSKAAQNILFKETCRTVSRTDFRINMITFGGVNTNLDDNFIKKYSSQVPLNRMVSPEDVVDCIKWLLLESPEIVNGSEFLVDGGWSLAN